MRGIIYRRAVSRGNALCRDSNSESLSREIWIRVTRSDECIGNLSAAVQMQSIERDCRFVCEEKIRKRTHLALTLALYSISKDLRSFKIFIFFYIRAISVLITVT